MISTCKQVKEPKRIIWLLSCTSLIRRFRLLVSEIIIQRVILKGYCVFWFKSWFKVSHQLYHERGIGLILPSVIFTIRFRDPEDKSKTMKEIFVQKLSIKLNLSPLWQLFQVMNFLRLINSLISITLPLVIEKLLYLTLSCRF